MLRHVGDQDPADVYADLDSFLAAMTEQELRIALAFFWSREARKTPVVVICERVVARLLHELSRREANRSVQDPEQQAGA
jgi:hypothetical protein